MMSRDVMIWYRIVRLMTAASPFVAAEEVSAEFLFVLCKENGK